MKKKRDARVYWTILVAFLIGFVAGSFYPQSQTGFVTQNISNTSGRFKVDMYIPAVDENGNGIATMLEVQAAPGNGRILTNIDKLLFWVDTQYSMQVAKQVAENITGINADKFDLVYTIKTNNATIVGGPSAGAALTIATIAALEHKEPRKDVMITGTINGDGSIGKVGGVLEKARAAKSVGADLFLVPYEQSSDTFLAPVENCTKTDNFVFCQTRYLQKTVDIGNETNITVKEVENIRQAANYFNL